MYVCSLFESVTYVYFVLQSHREQLESMAASHKEAVEELQAHHADELGSIAEERRLEHLSHENDMHNLEGIVSALEDAKLEVCRVDATWQVAI